MSALKHIDNLIFDWIDGRCYARTTGWRAQMWVRLWHWYLARFERTWGEGPWVTNN